MKIAMATSEPSWAQTTLPDGPSLDLVHDLFARVGSRSGARSLNGFGLLEERLNGAVEAAAMWPRDPSKEDRIAAFARDEYACRYCDRDKYTYPRLELHVDHIIPWSRGGSNELDNLVIACRDCNLRKSAGEALHLLPSRRERRELCKSQSLRLGR